MTDREALRARVARALCQEKCAFYGEPPCWGLDPNEYVVEPWNPDTCDEPGCGALADAAIDLVMEEAAKIASEWKVSITGVEPISNKHASRIASSVGPHIAAALRAYVTRTAA